MQQQQQNSFMRFVCLICRAKVRLIPWRLFSTSLKKISHLKVWQHFERRKHRRRIYLRREGCPCYLGDRIVSIPCRDIYFASGRYEEYDDLHQDDL